MKDVARLANVSTATVSHVINHTRNVNPETREKVLKAISDLKYKVNPVARNLRSGSSRMIGYVVSNLANYFYTDIALSIDETLSEQGYHLIYINSNEDPDKEKENLRSLVMQNVDGLIIAPVGQDCSYMRDLIGDQCPCVFFDRAPLGFERDVIMSTNREGAAEGTELLIKNGYRRPAFLGSRYDETMGEREDGFRDTLIRNNISVDEDLIRTGSGIPRSMNELRVGEFYNQTRDLVENMNVDSFFCGNVLSAVGVINYLSESRYSIPEDIGVVTFDDPFWLTMAEPKVTAVNQNKFSIGQRVARTLLARISGDEKPYGEYRVPTNLVIRNSC